MTRTLGRFAELLTAFEYPGDRFSEIPRYKLGWLRKIAFVAGLVLASADKHSLQTRGHGTANIGFGVVTDHYGLRTFTPHTIDRKLEEICGWFAEQDRVRLARILECSDERAGIQTEFAVFVFEVSVFGQCQERCSGDQLSISAIETVIGKVLPCIADNDSLAGPRTVLGKILLEIRMHKQKGGEALSLQIRARHDGWREQLSDGNVETHLSQIRDHLAARASRRVGNESHRNASAPEPSDSGSGSCNGCASDIDDTAEVKEHAS